MPAAGQLQVRRQFENSRPIGLGEAGSVWFAWIMWLCGQIRTWGARLRDRCQSALLARSALPLAASPEHGISVGIVAINAMVVRRIMAMTPPGPRLPDCGSGLVFAVHEAGILCDEALLREGWLRDRTRGAVRFGGPSRCLARPLARFGAGKPDFAPPADSALERLTWQARWLRCRPEACIASRGLTCCSAYLSRHGSVGP